MLKGLVSRILPEDIEVDYVVFEEKSDLEKRLPMKLRAWRRPVCGFIVLRDQDAGDCVEIKKRILDSCPIRESMVVLIRIACHELESFYLGDLAAVEKGLGIRGLERKQDRRQFREPDRFPNPSFELKRLTGQKYQKIAGSRSIGPHLNPDKNRSVSFLHLVAAIRRVSSRTCEPGCRDGVL